MNLKEIAKRAGVSTATVSNVINGNYKKVSEDTRKKVEDIIRETNYKPNVMARTLATNESHIIGVVIPYIGRDEDFFSNPYNAHIIASLEKYVREHDYYFMLRCVDDPRGIISLLSSWNVDGAFFLGVLEKEVGEIRKRVDIPMVFLDTYAPGESIINVGIEDYRGGYLSAKYLIGKGHRNIALVEPPVKNEGVILERHQGFMDACRESGIEIDPSIDIYVCDSVYRSAVGVGQDIVISGKGYTAVATMSDIAAFGVVEGIQQCGLKVPYDISVIGFDNLPDCDFMTPKLTTVAQDFEWKAKTAADYLFRILSGENDIKGDERQPIRVVERQSVRNILEGAG